MATTILKTSNDYSNLVGYEYLDPFKRLCLEAALKTSNRFVKQEPLTLGESASVVWDNHGNGTATVIEGLGTKSIIAQVMYELTKDPSGFSAIARDNAAMILNDLITVGAIPTTINMYMAVGNAELLKDEVRNRAIVDGFLQACLESNVLWTGGETPALRDIIISTEFDFAGSATGMVFKDTILHGDKICPEDRIILIESSGVHANGISAARGIVSSLSDGYLHKMPSGQLYGKALLKPTANYVPIMNRIIDEKIELHYAVNITGHGLRKLMRAVKPLHYVVERLFPVLEEFLVIQKHNSYTMESMYLNYNMGQGFALYAPQSSVKRIIEICNEYNLSAIDAGYIKADTSKKLSLVEPQIFVEGSSLDIR